MNNIDSYQAARTVLDPPLISLKPETAKAKFAPKVPVLRVFGATETGQKVCAHIHGAFPYLFVEYTGSLVPDDGIVF